MSHPSYNDANPLSHPYVLYHAIMKGHSMRTVGIIAEYNPFHNGHLRQIRYAREVLGADRILIAMSGYFTQRGEPALLSVRDRAHMAIAGGADLVLMLPCLYATSASIDYARAGVRLLASTGLVDTLLFGAETGDMTFLRRAAHFEHLLQSGGEFQNIRSGTAALPASDNTTDDLRDQLQKKLCQGISYTKASRQLIAEVLLKDSSAQAGSPGGALSASDDPQSVRQMEQLLFAPNNILAIDYLAAVEEEGLPWNLALIKRDCDYHGSGTSTTGTASASAIRTRLSDFGFMRSQMPAEAAEICMDRIRKRHFLLPENLDFAYACLINRLRAPSAQKDILDLDADLCARIIAQADQFTSLRSFVEEIISNKSRTSGRVYRALCHLLLNYHTEDKRLLERVGSIPYLQVIGLHRDARPLLGQLAKKASRPLLLRHSDYRKLLQSEQNLLLTQAILRNYQMDLLAEEIYCTQMQLRCKQRVPRIREQKLLLL